MKKKFTESPYVRAYEQRAVNQELARSEATGAPIRMHLTKKGRRHSSRGQQSTSNTWIALGLVVLVLVVGAALVWLLPLAIRSLGG